MENVKNDDNVQGQKKRPESADSEFDEAVDRVYQKYGSDLGAFVRDVQKELQKKVDGNKRSACGANFL
jgi:hypothetical protein